MQMKWTQQLEDVRHYNAVIMSTMAAQLTSLAIVYSTVYSGADQRKNQTSTLLAFLLGIHRWPVNSFAQWASNAEIFPFDDVFTIYMKPNICILTQHNHEQYGRWSALLPTGWELTDSCRVFYKSLTINTQDKKLRLNFQDEKVPYTRRCFMQILINAFGICFIFHPRYQVIGR